MNSSQFLLVATLSFPWLIYKLTLFQKVFDETWKNAFRLRKYILGHEETREMKNNVRKNKTEAKDVSNEFTQKHVLQCSIICQNGIQIWLSSSKRGTSSEGNMKQGTMSMWWKHFHRSGKIMPWIKACRKFLSWSPQWESCVIEWIVGINANNYVIPNIMLNIS